MSKQIPKDQEARQLIRTALDENLVVEAAAGTGKTTALVGRIIEVLATGRARVDEIVAVTFTEKAAGELKLRLRAELEEARRAAADNFERQKRLELALAHLEEARVSTIHGFCADLLRERPVEARVDPQFEVLQDLQAGDLFDQTFQLWMQEKLNDPPEGVRRSLRRPVFRDDGEGPARRLRRAAWDLTEWRDFPAPWVRPAFARETQVDEIIERMREFVALRSRAVNRAKNRLYRDTESIWRLSRDIEETERLRKRDYDDLEARLVEVIRNRDYQDFRHPKGTGEVYGEGLTRRQILAAHGELLGLLERFARDADADLAALLHSELQEVIDRYEDAKQRLGRVDFLDLLLKARNLVRDDGRVRSEMQQRFRAIFVDEFQDTDPLQAEILMLLACDDAAQNDWRQVVPGAGRLFIVGDPKQSIYRFRRANVGVYDAVKEQLGKCGAQILYLSTSFRSVPSIQSFVNSAFAPVMQRNPETLQAEYIALEPSRAEHAGQPTVVALPVPKPYGKRGITKDAIEQSLPDAIGAFVDWLVRESGWTVTTREDGDKRVPIQPRHICLLFRRFEKYGAEMPKKYVEALEARGIAHLLVGGKSFHRREEVETLRAALTAIEWPDDELAIFATLRGFLFAVGDAALLEYRHHHRRLHPFHLPAEKLPDHLQPIADALRILQELHRRRNQIPVAATISRLLSVTRAHAGFVLRPAGEQVLANVLHIPELARAYEGAGGISFREFVEQLRADAEEGQAPEAPILEDGSDGVRILTVHKAKGLEFPVVILADITARLSQTRASRWIDPVGGVCATRLGGWLPAELLEHEGEEVARDRAEGVRIAYVAATRARDLLVIPDVGDQGAATEDWWTGPLHQALWPLGHAARCIAAPGCPNFGRDTVQNRPPELAGEVNSVRPGLYQFEEGYSAAWWDPECLGLGVDPSFTLRQQQLLEKEDPEALVSGHRVYREWQEQRTTALTAGAKPVLMVYRATDPAAPAPALPEVTLVELGGVAAAAATGRRYGDLVHRVLAAVPLDADAAIVQGAARLHGRILGATAAEVAAATAVAVAVLRHPVLERARAADQRGLCRRETPVTARMPGGALIEGVVDLAFREGDAWTVVDFKTGRELEQKLESYRRQVGLYAAAIAEATLGKAQGILLKV